MKCYLCYSEYSTIYELAKHLKTVHDVRNGVMINCVSVGCGQKFNRLYNLIRHFKRFHDSESFAIESCANEIERFSDFDVNSTNNDSLSIVLPSHNKDLAHSENGVLPFNINKVKDTALNFCSEIISKNNVTYTSAVSFVELTSNLLSNTTNFLMESIESSGIDLPSSVHDDFKKVKNILAPFKSVYKFRQQFESLETYIKPIEIELGTRFEQRFVQGSVKQIQVKDTYQYIPICKLLEALFSRHDLVNLYY